MQSCFFVAKQRQLSFCFLVCRLVGLWLMSISICHVWSGNALINFYLFYMFMLKFFVPINNLSNVGTLHQVLVWTITKQRIECLCQAHSTVTQLSLKLTTFWFPSKRTTKVRKRAKIRNQYNQASHLRQLFSSIYKYNVVHVMASICSLDETPKPLNEYHETSGFMLWCAFALFLL